MAKKLLFIMLLLGVLAVFAEADKLKLTWEKKYDDAIKKSQSTNKPVLIFLTCNA